MNQDLSIALILIPALGVVSLFVVVALSTLILFGAWIVMNFCISMNLKRTEMKSLQIVKPICTG